MNVENWPISKPIPYSRNPRRNEAAISKVAGSIKEFGWRQPIVVDTEGVIIAGHTRLLAAQHLRLQEVPVHVATDLSPQQIKAYRLADNRVAQEAEWDNDLLKLELSELEEEGFSLDLTGFSEDELEALLAEGTEDGLTDEDETPEVEEEAITLEGDLWILGNHRLLCADSTKSDSVIRLMGNSRINLAFTSPPYASQRKYDETSGFKPINEEDFVSWWQPIQQSIKDFITDDGSFFINIKPNCEGFERSLYVFDLVIAMKRKWGWLFAEEFCWERVGIPQQVVRRFKNQFEPIYQFTLGDWKFRPKEVMRESNSVPQPLGKGAGDTNAAKRQGKQGAVDPNEVKAGMAYPGNRLPTFSSTHTALGHSAAFPVGLPSFFIKAYSDKNDCIYEPFCGSGSTIIASEQLNRKCFAMEISPQYTDISIKRWQQFTGKEAILESSNKTFAEVEAERKA